MPGVALYLLVRDADGAILEEFDSPAGALRAWMDHDPQLCGDTGVSLVRYDDHQGGIVGTTSYVTARIANLVPPRA